MARQNRSVMIDGVEYRPVSEGNPNAEQIARAIMEEFWGELTEDFRWEDEAGTLFVGVDTDSSNGPSVMTVVGRILARMANQTADLLGETINDPKHVDG